MAQAIILEVSWPEGEAKEVQVSPHHPQSLHNLKDFQHILLKVLLVPRLVYHKFLIRGSHNSRLMVRHLFLSNYRPRKRVNLTVYRL